MIAYLGKEKPHMIQHDRTQAAAYGQTAVLATNSLIRNTYSLLHHGHHQPVCGHLQFVRQSAAVAVRIWRGRLGARQVLLQASLA